MENDKICLPVFNFGLLILAFFAVIVWFFCKMIQILRDNKDWSMENLMKAFIGTSDQVGGYYFDQYSYDDLAVGEVPPAHRDYRKVYDPLKAPTRRYVNYPDYFSGSNFGQNYGQNYGFNTNYGQNSNYLGRTGYDYNQNQLIPALGFNYPTQGYLPSFQLVGFLTNPNNSEQVLKLYGRRTDKYKWEYYVTHHEDRDLKIPLEIKGDNELYGGETVDVTGYKDKFQVHIYEFEAPRYVAPGGFY